MTKKNLKLLSIIGLGAVIIITIFFFNYVKKDSQIAVYESAGNKDVVTVYKSPTCGCCVNYVAYLRKNRYEVNIVEEKDMSIIKDKYNISRSMESCHTAIFGKYFVEGHVPLSAVNELLSEHPDVDGISLPGMPAGSPGMPGKKSGSFTIYSLADGRNEVYLNE